MRLTLQRGLSGRGGGVRYSASWLALLAVVFLSFGAEFAQAGKSRQKEPTRHPFVNAFKCTEILEVNPVAEVFDFPQLQKKFSRIDQSIVEISRKFHAYSEAFANAPKERKMHTLLSNEYSRFLDGLPGVFGGVKKEIKDMIYLSEFYLGGDVSREKNFTEFRQALERTITKAFGKKPMWEFKSLKASQEALSGLQGGLAEARAILALDDVWAGSITIRGLVDSRLAKRTLGEINTFVHHLQMMKQAVVDDPNFESSEWQRLGMAYPEVIRFSKEKNRLETPKDVYDRILRKEIDLIQVIPQSGTVRPKVVFVEVKSKDFGKVNIQDDYRAAVVAQLEFWKQLFDWLGLSDQYSIALMTTLKPSRGFIDRLESLGIQVYH